MSDLAAVVANPDCARRGFLQAGNPRPTLVAATKAARGRGTGVLVLVLETEGSTYAGAGAMAFFNTAMLDTAILDEVTQVGWLSGGCLEPELARRAADAAAAGRIEWMEIDTRADEDLLSGSALGCRGRLRVAMLPLHTLPGIDAVLDAWLRGGTPLERLVQGDGVIALATHGVQKRWLLPSSPSEWAGAGASWSLPLPRPPEALVFGAGPESPFLLQLLRELGWRTTLVESRPRWRAAGVRADTHFDRTPLAALVHGPNADVALVMHHNFELDRETLEALSGVSVPFVGLLGPRHRRDDLFKLLSPLQRRSLETRLRSPVGLDLGGTGPEAIALSIAAQLQVWRAGGE